VPQELISSWKQCGIIADFIAKYNTVNYSHQDKVISTLSTITNELLENAINFSDSPNALISIALKANNHSVLIETINTATESSVNSIVQFVKLLKKDHSETVQDLGLMRVVKNYDASLGIKVQPLDDANDYNIYVKLLIPNTVLESL
jgi:hypothetical protein